SGVEQVEGADAGRVLDEVTQLVRAVAGDDPLGGLDPDPPQTPVGRLVEGYQDRAGDRHEGPHGQCEQDGGPLRVGDRPRLRRHLPDDEVQEGDDDERQDEPGDVREHVRRPEPLDRRRQPVVERGFGDRPQGEGAGGDAELGAGEEDGQLSGAPQRGPGGPAGGGRLLEPVAAGAEQRELDGDEERAQPDEHHRSGEYDPGVTHWSTFPSSATCSGRATGISLSRLSRSLDGTRRSTSRISIRRARAGGSSSSARSAGLTGSATVTVVPGGGRVPLTSMVRPAMVS